LRRHYEVSLTAPAPQVQTGGWELTLVPRDRALLDAVSRVMLRGAGTELAAVEIVEANGDLTLMQISALPNPSVRK
ncbi:MAG TPA: LolA-related protein, partial [Burkholderiaceae bacterium]|nr:LolA-related protein [Burkholderiaceae bacterium]